MFKNFKVSAKLGIGFCIMILIAASIGLTGIIATKKSNTMMDGMYGDNLLVVAEICGVSLNSAFANRSLYDYAIENEPGEQNKIKTEIENNVSEANRLMGTFKKTKLAPEEKELVSKFDNSWSHYVADSEKVIEYGRAKKSKEALQLLNGAATQEINEVEDDTDKLIKLNMDQAKLEYNDSDAAVEKTEVIITSLTIAAAIFGIFIGFLITRGITVPLAEAVGLAQRVANSDLTSVIEVKSKDETGKLMQALKDMTGNLRNVVNGVKASTDNITSAASQISAGNSDLSSRTQEQASALEETAASMEELSSTVKQNAENAKQANQLAVAASGVAIKGGQVVGEVVGTMSSINDSSRKIVDIISVIDGIAFQTNILALNAAVEAARAGEQGRGFAVVAAEVRNLAQRSAAAAKEIKQLIGDSVDKVENGTKLVAQAGETMEEIVTSVKRVTDIMGEIAAASAEQSSGIDQINNAVTQMDQVTQQNAALVEEAAAAAESLEDQAQELTVAVSVFKIDGSTSPTSKARRLATKVSAAPVHHDIPKTKAEHVTAKAIAQGDSKLKLLKTKAKAEEEWEEF